MGIRRVFLSFFAASVLLFGLATSAMAATQTLTILGADGQMGDIAPNTEYSLDGGATWHQAYLSGSHPWGFLPGTNSWINQSSDNTVGAALAGSTKTTLYRLRFYVPVGATNINAILQLNPDNEADVKLNGQHIGGTPSVIGGVASGWGTNAIPGPTPSSLDLSGKVAPGVNELDISVIDQGGITGFNYRIDITADASTPLAVLPPSSSPAGMAMASGNLTRTPWQQSHPHAPYTLPAGVSASPYHGGKADYYYAAIPAANDASWGAAPNGDTIDFGGASASILTACWSQVDYNYFQTFVTVPTSVNVTQFSIVFKNMDDGSRVTIFNSAYPKGILVNGSYATLNTTGGIAATADLASYIVPGVNRVVITQVDDCPSGNNLGYAGVTINTQTITSSNKPPVANAGAAQTVQCTGNSSANVTLNGSASSDPDGDALTYTWTWPGGSATGATPTVSMPMAGSPTTVTLTVSDGHGATSTATTSVMVVDTTPPTVSAGPDQTVEATGPDGAAFDVSKQASASDTCCDPTLTAPASTTYPLGKTTVKVTATDCSGNSASDSMVVDVVDTTPPTVTAKLVPVSVHGHEGTFQVEITAKDLVDPNPTITATVNGATVTNGQTVKLVGGHHAGVDNDDGVLKIRGSSFTLTATATDFSGNTSAPVTDSYAFPTRGDDDNGIHRGNDKTDNHVDHGQHKSEGKDKIEHKH